MENVKKPEFVVSSATAIGLIGLGSFFYKRSMDLENELTETKKHLSSVVKMTLVLEKRLNELEQLKNLPAAVQEQFNKTNAKQQQEQRIFAQTVSDYSNEVNTILKDNGISTIEAQ